MSLICLICLISRRVNPNIKNIPNNIDIVRNE
jgi:hypothetical protein